MRKILLSLLCVLFVATAVQAQFISTPPTIDATKDGTASYPNTFTTGTTNYTMSWDDTYLYVWIGNANQSEPVSIYFDVDPLAIINGGTNTDGTLVGLNYDGYTTRPALPFRADVCLYAHNTYRELFRRDGGNSWTTIASGNGGLTGTANDYVAAPTGQYASNDNGNGNNGDDRREFKISWSRLLGTINGGIRPAAFNFMGYVSYSNGMYAPIPSENYNGNAVTSNTTQIVRYYTVTDAASTSISPFSKNSYSHTGGTSAGFGAISVYDFTMNAASGSITRASGAGGNWDIANNFIINNGGINFGATTSACNVTGNLSISSVSGSLSLSGTAGGDINSLQGNFTVNSGSFNGNNRAVIFTGANVQDITAISGVNIPYLLINKTAGRVRLLSNVTVAGTGGGNILQLQSAASILDLNGNTFTLGSAGNSSAVTSTGSIRGSSTSTLAILGTGALGTINFDQTTPGTTNNIGSFSIDRTSSGSVTLGNALNIYGVLTVSNGALDLGSNLVTLKSTATGTARIAASTTANAPFTYTSGSFICEKYMPGGGSAFPGSGNSTRGYRFISHPINAATSVNQITNSFTSTEDIAITGNLSGVASDNNAANVCTGCTVTATNAPSAFRYDPTTSGNISTINSGGSGTSDPGWKPITDIITSTGVNAWNPGQAMRVFYRGLKTQGLASAADYTVGSATLNMIGKVNVGGVSGYTVNLTYGNNGGTNQGFNLVGNPFASPVNIKTVTRTNINPIVYVFVATQGNRGGFKSVDLSAVANYNLPAYSGFFAEVATNAAANMNFKESDKATSETADVLFRTLQAGYSRVVFSVDGISPSMNWDEFQLNIKDGETAAKDNNDGWKFYNSDVNFYSASSDNKPLSVDYRPFADNTVIPMVFTSSQARAFTINLSSVDIEPGKELFFVDKYLNISTPITTGFSYSFNTTADPASQGQNRFEISIKTTSSLPVCFTNIKAAQKNTGIDINWTTSCEINMANYQVEKSANGTTFSKLGTDVAALNNGAASNTYNYVDVQPFSGNNFFRIKATEKNGNIVYSQIVNVKLGGGKNNFTVAPTLIQNGTLQLQMEGVDKGKYNLNLYNNAGQLVAVQTVNHTGGSATESMDVSKLAKGNYNLNIVGNNTTITKKVVVQ